MDNYYKEMEPSAATASGNLPAADQTNDYQKKVKKSKNIPDGGASRSWSFSDPESRRKRRVAGYKVYSVEQKMKGSIRKKLQMVQRHYQKRKSDEEEEKTLTGSTMMCGGRCRLT
ncbi:hypothetical protein Bca4012_029132 [Brassica carinata]